MQQRTSYDIIIGSYGTKDKATIHWLTLDIKEGKFRRLMAYKDIENPSYLTVNRDKTKLYAISEVDHGSIHSYQIDHHKNQLYKLNAKLTHGSPCYVTLTEDEQFVLSANYGGGSFISHYLNDDGSLGTSSDLLVHEASEPDRISHIHTIRNIPGTDYYIATDLGQDKLYVYMIDSKGQFHLQQTVDLPDRSGPRHISFHPTLNILYVITEFQSTVYTLTFTNDLSHMQFIQSSPTLPEGFLGNNYGADIHVTDSGKFLFTSNRGHHSVTTFKISSDGTIEPFTYTPTHGEWPRHFTILPDGPYMIIANEHTNNIVGMAIKDNGELEQVTAPYPIVAPVCIKSL